MRLLRFLIVAAVSGAILPGTSYSACQARSGSKTAALVELYTSEGCSSCPPADRQLRHLGQVLDAAAEVVPLALHVGYWDYIGWKDPYAKAAFGERQDWLASANQQQAVYTPQFFVSGVALPSQQGSLREQVRRINAQAATATLRVQAEPTTDGSLELITEATIPAKSPPTALYLVITESGLVSQVMRGENSGVTLTHDHVVREWIGPVRLARGAAKIQRTLSLPAEWHRARLDVVAFVQDEHSGSVLQALSAQHCAGS